MKKNVVLLLLLLVFLILPVAVYAGSPHEEVVAYFWYVPAFDCEESFPGSNYIGRNCTDTGTYGTSLPLGVPPSSTTDGDFLGTSTEVYDLVLHDFVESIPPDLPVYEGKGYYKGIVTFTGTVFPGTDKERSGVMDIMYIGKTPPGEWVWSGTWRILGGEGGLEGITGGGTWQGSSVPGYYVELEGKVHFN